MLRETIVYAALYILHVSMWAVHHYAFCWFVFIGFIMFITLYFVVAGIGLEHSNSIHKLQIESL